MYAIVRHYLPFRGSHNVLTPLGHSKAVCRERYALITQRSQLLARVLALLTVCWVVVDLATLSWQACAVIAPARLAAAFALLGLSRAPFFVGTAAAAYRAIGGLITIPVALFLFADVALWSLNHGDLTPFAANVYLYGPLMLAAGLSVFPLAAVEAFLLALPAAVAVVASIELSTSLIQSMSTAATLWWLALMVSIASLAAMSQLKLMIELTERTARDALTGVWSRKSGEELIRMQFAVAARARKPLALLFADLDKFKLVNDRFGHAAGDALLRQVAHALQSIVREHDVVIRWGGEEFVVILPETDRVGAEAIIKRISEFGIGLRPEGTAQTLSAGIAERISDNATDWTALIDVADHRMYAAKQAGRSRFVSSGSAQPTFLPYSHESAAA